MKEGNVEQRVVGWVELADRALATIMPYFAALFQSGQFTPDEIRVLSELSAAAWGTTGSVLILIEHQRLWDAEIVLRATCEATLKFAYILSDRNKASDRLREFSDTLFWLSSAKDHAKAKEVLSVVPAPEDECWRPLREMLLSDDALEHIKERPEWSERRDIERRWGFTELISELLSTGDERWRGVGSLAHVFNMQSHILHADAQGVGIVMERQYREDIRRDFVHAAHAAKIVSDLLSFALLRLMEANRFLDFPRECISEPIRLVVGLLNSLKSAAAEWHVIEYPSPLIPTSNRGCPRQARA